MFRHKLFVKQGRQINPSIIFRFAGHWLGDFKTRTTCPYKKGHADLYFLRKLKRNENSRDSQKLV